VVIVDFAHCGTTMLAGIIHLLGVPMVGHDYNAAKWEDFEISRALQNGEAAFAAVARERDATFGNWGFKCPGIWNQIDVLDRVLIEPVYLAIFKDPVSVTLRRFGNDNGRRFRYLNDTMRQMKKAIDGMGATGRDISLFSYSRAVGAPWQFVRKVASVIGAIPTAKQAEAAAGFIRPNTGGPRTDYPAVWEYIAQYD
jgi:hypothetical protein